MKYVQDFDQLDRKALPQVGGKNANLGELIQSGIRVPPGFAVNVGAYLRYIDSAGLGERIAGLIERVHVDDSAALDRVQPAEGENPGKVGDQRDHKSKHARLIHQNIAAE